MRVTLTFEQVQGLWLIEGRADNPTDNSIAACASCGAEFGRWGDVKEAMVQTAKDALSDTFRDLVKGVSKSFKT
jgi:hypothetical protein